MSIKQLLSARTLNRFSFGEMSLSCAQKATKMSSEKELAASKEKEENVRKLSGITYGLLEVAHFRTFSQTARKLSREHLSHAGLYEAAHKNMQRNYQMTLQ